MARKVKEIASEIKKVWGSKISPYAKPYLEALLTLSEPSDDYFLESGEEIALRFLCNASSFRGEDAKRLKAELKQVFNIK